MSPVRLKQELLRIQKALMLTGMRIATIETELEISVF